MREETPNYLINLSVNKASEQGIFIYQTTTVEKFVSSTLFFVPPSMIGLI